MTVSITAGSGKSEIFNCNSCPSAYITQNGLDRHTEKEHPPKEPAKEENKAPKETPPVQTTSQLKHKVSDFKCPDCSMLYLSKAGLEKHIEKEHKESDSPKPQEKTEPVDKKEAIVTSARKKIPDYKCPKCPSIYLSQTGVDKHIEKEHKSDDSSTKPKDSDESGNGQPRRRMSTFSCLQCESKFLTRSGLDEHIQKGHGKEDEKTSKKEEGKELKMNETVIGFKASKPSRNKNEIVKAKVTKNDDIEEVEIEEVVDEKPSNEGKSKGGKQTKKPSEDEKQTKKPSKAEKQTKKAPKDEKKTKKPSKDEKQTKKTPQDDEIVEMDVDEPEKKSLSKTKCKTKTVPKASTRPTGFICKKCNKGEGMKFITSGGLEAHMKKRHSNAKPTKETKPKEDINEQEDDGGFIWPPEVGSTLATLFDDDFYLGKVLKIAANKTVKVQYMIRYKKVSKDSKDQFWVWPDKPDPPFGTARESVLGVNAIIEKDEKYSTKQNTVYSLTNHATWSRLGKSSRIGL